MDDYVDEDKLRRQIWNVELEILDVIHNICVANDLKYSLAYGTLIGAVRHKGFIPWDDDIDIVMPRGDYEKIVSIWKYCAPSGYIIEEPYSCGDTVINFAKIRKDHTTFIQSEFEKEKKYHKGIFVDIFPLDRVAEKSINRRIQKMFCMISMLYNRGYTSKTGGIIEFTEKVLLSIVPTRQYRKVEKWAEYNATKWNNNSNWRWFGFSTMSCIDDYFPADSFDKLQEIEFEGKKYFAFSDFDIILRETYGDYMKLPPIEERKWKHGHVLIDFEHNYEELECLDC